VFLDARGNRLSTDLPADFPENPQQAPLRHRTQRVNYDFIEFIISTLLDCQVDSFICTIFASPQHPALRTYFGETGRSPFFLKRRC
jgi:hypothetical protein